MRGWQQLSKNSPWRTHDLRRDRRLLKILREIKDWQLLVILLILAMLTAIFLRLNNIGMVELRAELIKIDKTGNIAQVKTAAVKLQNYVTKHMNTDTGRVALQTLYNNAAQAAINAARPKDVDTTLYQRVTEECIPQRYSGGTRAWAQCVANRIGTTLVEEQNVEAVSPDAYYVDFASPVFSFDLAGIMVLICCLLVFIVIFRLILVVILRIILKIKYHTH
ncbi:hypothetical protein FWF74_01770 [Candidatus Saccharibacteria bacterium]|nr:hypothetical protein [Candidatus Saccharibacteria bacterium]MCL1963192.1 hypothetical protein [Candidatus Saccharibacteria bacterium]